MIGREKMIVPRISIIVPAYNAETWLKDCCHSVFNQTYPNWELLLVDDGSTDNTLSIARQEASGRENVKVIHTENGGVCHARNIGMDAATGEYISFLDADDLLLPDALEYLYSLLTNRNADIAIGQKINVKPNGETTPNYYPEKEVFWTGTEGLVQSLQDHPATYSVWAKLYRKKIVEDIRFVEGKKVHEDSFFVFQCLMKQPAVAVADRVVLQYRLIENSASRSAFSEKVFDIIFFAERKKAIIEKEYPEFIPLTENVIAKANMALLWNLLKTNHPKYRAIEKAAIKNVLDRREYYTAAIKSDDKMFWILTHRLYGVYKVLYALRKKFYSFQ